MSTPPSPGQPWPEIKMYTVAGAAEATTISRALLYEYIKSGRLHSLKVGKRRLIPAESLRDLLQGGER